MSVYTDPAWGGVAVTPSDSTNLTTPARALWVGGAGTVSIVMRSGVALSFAGVPAGTLLPIGLVRVNSTGTTASNMVALF